MSTAESPSVVEDAEVEVELAWLVVSAVLVGRVLVLAGVVAEDEGKVAGGEVAALVTSDVVVEASLLFVVVVVVVPSVDFTAVMEAAVEEVVAGGLVDPAVDVVRGCEVTCVVGAAGCVLARSVPSQVTRRKLILLRSLLQLMGPG